MAGLTQVCRPATAIVSVRPVGHIDVPDKLQEAPFPYFASGMGTKKTGPIEPARYDLILDQILILILDQILILILDQIPLH